MLPRATRTMDGVDSFSKIGGESQNDISVSLLDASSEDPFNDSGGDFFDKFLADEEARNNSSGNLADGNLLMSANESTFEAMLDSTLNKTGGGDSMNLDIPEDLVQLSTKPNTAYSFTGDNAGGHQGRSMDLVGNVAGALGSGSGSAAANTDQSIGAGTNNWFFPSSGAAGTSAQRTSQNTMLDAAPLNISLGGGGNSSTIASTLRRKGSNAQLSASKMGSVRKVNLTSSKLRSAKSEGMLARALKAKYNSGTSLNKYSVNAATASVVISGRLPRDAISAMARGTSSGAIAQHLSQSSFYNRGSKIDINAVEKEESSGAKNATWGSTSSRKPGASLFANLLAGSQSTSMSKDSSIPNMASSSSTVSLLRKHNLLSSSSRSSMQDLLRLSKKQSKTQSMLRQSSAQSLLKQTSSQSLKGMSKKVDVSSLLPPQHATLNSSTNGSNQKFGNGAANLPAAPPANPNDAETSSLLHQSCRLYPKTAAVVESALRIDPDAVRNAVPVTLEKGQSKKAQHIYGYPVNIALAHGGSLEVIKMLIDAAPDILIKKDGNDGSGSLGVALMHNPDMELICLLVQANPECVKTPDRRGNYPLHVAVSHGLPFATVKRLHAIYPKALNMRNFHSETPLDIAQRSTRCSEEVMNYLQSTAFSQLEHNAYHLEQHNTRDLEDGLDDIMETNF